ncbi:MAG: hypothetical protein AAGC77_04005 [Pseudomonadota bacterium]
MSIEFPNSTATAYDAQQTDEPFDAAWKEKTTAGNAAFDHGDHASAKAFYRDATDEAWRQFKRASAGIVGIAEDVAPMMVVCALNSARNFQSLGHYAAMEHAFIATADVFLATLSDAQAPKALKNACILHFPKMLSEYRNLLSETRQDQVQFDEYFRKARDASISYHRSITTLN